MCSLPLFTNPWISADNPSAESAAVVTASTNPAPLGIQTFLENVHLYIYIYSYIHISNIFVTVYALNARGSAKNIWGLYYAKSKPRIRFFQRSPISDIENVCCPHTQIILFTLRCPLFKTETFMSPPDHIEICIFFSFFPFLFQPEQFHIRFINIFVKQLLLDSKCMHSWMIFFLFVCLLSAVLMIYLFIFLSFFEGGHDVITIWHKIRNCIYLFIFGMGFFFFFCPLLHP